MKNIDRLCIDTIKTLSIDAVQRANSGHPGMPLGDADMAYVLWNSFLKHNPKNPLWPNRDRFVLSAGHGSMLLYSLLHLTGYDISLNELKNFRQLGSKTPGHPEYLAKCGIETTTGPLGQGFATGVGMAMAEKYLSETFNKPGFRLFDHNVYAIVSDGDIMEGVTAEAASMAGHMGLGKLVYLYSDNRITIEGSTELSMTENTKKRFESYGWHIQSVDAYDLKAVSGAIKKARAESKKPSLIIARTIIGHGSPTKQNTAGSHGSPLGAEEIKAFKESIGWPMKSFHIPPKAAVHMKKAIVSGKKAEASWNAMLKKYAKKHKDLYGTLKEAMDGNLPSDLMKSYPVFKPEDGKVATRSASGKFLNSVASSLPLLIGGSADLAPSNNTMLKDYPSFGEKKGGRNIHFGIREHAMAAALNGMALSGLIIPYGGTFLVFSDYMRPSIRLSALMKAHVIYVFTHDSIGLGEDGPTHQPIEHLTALRAIPGLTVLRPADANETVEAWDTALKHKNGPVALVLTRQGLPTMDRNVYAPAANVKKGGYVLKDSKKKKPDLIILATGSEVSIALEAALELDSNNISTRVVNIPSMELFDLQSAKYKESVLPKGVKRLAVEAGAPLSWYKYVGVDGDVIGMESFGESAPAGLLMEHFGFTAKNIIKRAGVLLKKK